MVSDRIYVKATAEREKLHFCASYLRSLLFFTECAWEFRLSSFGDLAGREVYGASLISLAAQ